MSKKISALIIIVLFAFMSGANLMKGPLLTWLLKTQKS